MQRPLRLWPGIAAAAVVALGLLITAALPVAAEYSLIATAVGVFAIILWWLFFSRAPWLERVGALVLMAVAVAADSPLHPRVRRGWGAGRPAIHPVDAADEPAAGRLGRRHPPSVAPRASRLDGGGHPRRQRLDRAAAGRMALAAPPCSSCGGGGRPRRKSGCSRRRRTTRSRRPRDPRRSPNPWPLPEPHPKTSRPSLPLSRRQRCPCESRPSGPGSADPHATEPSPA